MNRRRGWTMLVFGLLLAVGTGVGVFYLLQQQRSEMAEQARVLAAEAAVPVATVQLPVAARPLSPGTLLSPDDFQLKEYPVDLVPVTAITSTVSLESQMLAESVGQGETFRSSQLVGENAARVSQRLEAGQVLFAYPIVDLLSQIDLIQAGDHVDLLLTLDVATPDGVTVGPVTTFTLQNVAVFDVLRPGGDGEEDDEDTPEGRPVALLLSVAPEDAVLLKHVKDSDGTIDFVLRSAVDSETVDVPSVDREDFISRYNMR